jgi:hypothetical protein
MSSQERQLDLDRLFVSAHEGFVVSPGQANELSEGSPLCRADCRAGKSDAIIVANEH